MVGDRNLALARRMHPQRFRRTLRAPPRPTNYIFGSGAPVIARRKVLLNHPLLGDVEIDVVPGRLPFLIGRKLLKRAKISINFEKNFIESAQQAACKLRQSGSAYLISLQDTEKLIQRVGASGQSNFPSSEDRAAIRPDQRQEASMSSGGDKIISSATADGGIASAASGQERAARAKNQSRPSLSVDDYNASNSKEKVTKEFVCQYECCTALHADINVYAAATDATEISDELETHAIEGWVRAPTVEDSPPADASTLPTLRERSGSDIMISKETAAILQKRHPSRVWHVTAGFLQRIHLLG